MESYKKATTRLFAELNGMLAMIPEKDGRPLIMKMLILRDEIDAAFLASGIEKRTAPFDYRLPAWWGLALAFIGWLVGKLG